jgi:acetyltransferase-like isoleucine patch superfamily enzyme
MTINVPAPPTLRHDQLYEFKRNSHSSNVLLSSYDVIITVGAGRIRIGRFSTAALGRLSVIAEANSLSGDILTIGSMCDFAKTAIISIGGDHHPNIFNVTLNSSPIIKMAMDAENSDLASATSPRPIVIEDNVVISQGAVILGGAHIGARSVIGAGAVVAGTCDAYWSHGGVPAKPLRELLSKEHQSLFRSADMANVAAHQLHKLPVLAKRLMDGKIEIDDFRRSLTYLPARGEVHLAASISPSTSSIVIERISGFSISGVMITDVEKLSVLNGYFGQIPSTSETLKWSPDIFFAQGLLCEPTATPRVRRNRMQDCSS